MGASIPTSAMAFRPGVFDDGVRANLGYVRRAVESMWSGSAELGSRRSEFLCWMGAWSNPLPKASLPSFRMS